MRDDHDGWPDAESLGDGAFEVVRQGRAVGGGAGHGEDDVAALDVGDHVSMAECFYDGAELGHRHLVPTYDVDAADQSDVRSHDPIIPGRGFTSALTVSGDLDQAGHELA